MQHVHLTVIVQKQMDFLTVVEENALIVQRQKKRTENAFLALHQLDMTWVLQHPHVTTDVDQIIFIPPLVKVIASAVKARTLLRQL